MANKTFQFNDGANLYVNYGEASDDYVFGDQNVKIWAEENTEDYDRYCDLTFKTYGEEVVVNKRVWQNSRYEPYYFDMLAITTNTSNLGIQFGVQDESGTLINIPWTMQGESGYSPTSINDYWTNSPTNHIYNLNIGHNTFGNNILYVNISNNYNYINRINISSDMPKVNLANCFNNCQNLIDINGGALNLTNLSNTFNNCRRIVSLDELASWNTANVTNMSQTFRNCLNLANIDALASWDTSNIKNLAYTFHNCNHITYLTPISNWNTSNVTNMVGVFSGCQKLTSLDGLDSWNTSNVTNMFSIFFSCSLLTNLDGLANWDTSNVTNIVYLFYYCYNIPNVDALASWDTSNITSLTWAFYHCFNLTSLDGLASWDTSHVIDLFQTFSSCFNLTSLEPLASWDTSNVTNLFQTFSSCSNLSSLDGLASWNTSKVENMANTFYNCNCLTSLDGLSSWNTANVRNMSNTFQNCSNLKSANLNNFKGTNLNNIANIFQNCINLTSINFINNFNNITVNAYNAFRNCTNLVGDMVFNFNLSNATTMFANRTNAPLINVYCNTQYNAYNVLYNAMGNVTYNANWQVQLYNYYDYLFALNIRSEERQYNQAINFGVWDLDDNHLNIPITIRGVDGYYSGESMQELDYYSQEGNSYFNVGTNNTCSGASTSVFGFDITNYQNFITDINLQCNWPYLNAYEGFANENKLVNLTTSNITATNVSGLLFDCYNIADISALENWNVAMAASYASSFRNCYNIQNFEPLSGWKTANCTTLTWTFYDCYGMTNLNFINNWNLTQVKVMERTFWGCENITDLGNKVLNIPNVTTIQECFAHCDNASGNITILGDNITNAYDFFNKANTSLVNVYTEYGTDTWNSLYRALGNTMYNEDWNVRLIDNRPYDFEMTLLTSDSTNVAVQLGVLNASGPLVNIPWTIQGESGYSPTTVTNYWTNSTTEHKYNISINQNDFGVGMALHVETYNNTADITSANIQSTMPLINLRRGFNNCQNLTTFNSSALNVGNLAWCFQQCSNLSDISGLAFWNTQSVTSWLSMFESCQQLSDISPLSHLNTSKAISMNSTFYGCSQLTDLSPLADWDTSNVSSMVSTFAWCNQLSDISPLENWNTQSLTNIYYMFAYCNNATGNLYLRGNNITCARSFFTKANTYQVNVFAYNGTDTWNSLYSALGNTTYNASWNVYLYEL